MSSNPFYAYSVDGRDFFHVAADDRLRMVKDFDLEQCRAALALDGLQKTVRQAVERRMRKLERGAA